MLVKDKIDNAIKRSNHDMHTVSNFEELSISSNYERVQSIMSDTSAEDSGDEDHKHASKKEALV
eukprot:7975147-Ditylum_brightwellii.AAC.1